LDNKLYTKLTNIYILSILIVLIMSEQNNQKESSFYMLKIHPQVNRIMIQIDNGKIELNEKNQIKTYNLLKEHLLNRGLIDGD